MSGGENNYHGRRMIEKGKTRKKVMYAVIDELKVVRLIEEGAMDLQIKKRIILCGNL